MVSKKLKIKFEIMFSPLIKIFFMKDYDRGRDDSGYDKRYGNVGLPILVPLL